MRLYDLKTEDGATRAFEVENTLLTRGRACKIAASIPGATVVRRSRIFRDTDDFCEFTLEGETFIIEEQFGDNSRYWIGTKGISNSDSLLKVRAAFEQYKTLGSPLRVLLAVSALALMWYIYQSLTAFVAQDRCPRRRGPLECCSRPLHHERRTVMPNPSLNRRANGRPPSPGRRYAVHFRQPGLGGLPLSPG
jgi:hypothetical protein